MAHASGKKESTFFLWIIVPVAMLLTLLFVAVNNNATPPKEILDGTRAMTEHQMIESSHDAIHAPVADSLSADSTVATPDSAAAHAAH